MIRTTFLAAAFALLTAAAVSAEPDDGFCRNGIFPREQATFGVARVTGVGRLPFLGDMNGCPDASPRCRAAGFGYVIPGDRLITGRTRGDYVCAFYVSKAHAGSAGWVERARLAPEPVNASPPVAEWVGRWRDGDDSIRLVSAPGGALKAVGEAYWPAADPKSWPGGVHTGGVEAVARPQGVRLHLQDGEADGCRIDLQRVGPYLVASDNRQCGGANVTFTGVYERR